MKDDPMEGAAYISLKQVKALSESLSVDVTPSARSTGFKTAWRKMGMSASHLISV